MKKAERAVLPIDCLPRNGIGFFSEKVYQEIDLLQKKGMRCFQLPPIHPFDHGKTSDHPISAFAGNTDFIDLHMLIAEGALTQEEYAYMGFDTPELCDVFEQMQNRNILLMMAYERSNFLRSSAYFRFAKDNEWWLEDYALFIALKQHFDGVSWYEWPNEILMRKNSALEFYRQELRFEIDFQKYLQFCFFQQLGKLKEYANARGVQIVGNIIMGLDTDSADVWSHAELFSANSHVPGYALHYWKAHQDTNFAWWERRFHHYHKHFDLINTRTIHKRYSVLKYRL